MSNSVDPDETAECLIWIYAVCKNLLLLPVTVKEIIMSYLNKDCMSLPVKTELKQIRPVSECGVCYSATSDQGLIRICTVCHDIAILNAITN